MNCALRVILCALFGHLLCGCDASAPDSSAAPVVRGKGIVSGRVTLIGYTHPAKQQTVQCADHVTISDESVVTGPGNTLANVIVFIEKAPYAGPSTLEPAVLDQVNCRYVPHVLVLQVGQALTVRSSDATLHNVHTLSEANRAMNFGMSGKGIKELRFDEPEAPFRVKCDVHPWMSAHVAVFDHPYFAVTGPDGAFRIPNLPAGTYTLTAWHEKFLTLAQPITIDEKAPVEINFTYQPPNTDH